jgi:hypothetical protein
LINASSASHFKATFPSDQLEQLDRLEQINQLEHPDQLNQTTVDQLEKYRSVKAAR